MAIQLKLFQHKDTNKETDGKWYAKSVCTEYVDINYLASKISSHSPYSNGVVEGVIISLIDEMKCQMEDGKGVVLDHFGKFRYSVESELFDAPEDFNPQKHIRKVKCHFTPLGIRDQFTHKIIYPLLEGLRFRREK
jgi:predicted histone-like DNA-binding protein